MSRTRTLDSVEVTLRALRAARRERPDDLTILGSRLAILRLLGLYGEALQRPQPSPPPPAAGEGIAGTAPAPAAEDVLPPPDPALRVLRWSTSCLVLAALSLAFAGMDEKAFAETAVALGYCIPCLVLLGAPLVIWRALRQRRSATGLSMQPVSTRIGRG